MTTIPVGIDVEHMNESRMTRANREHLEMIKRGVKIWNRWREENRDIVPYLFAADLSRINFAEANLRGAQLIWSDLTAANLEKADLSVANLYGSDLKHANLTQANLQMVNLCEAKIDGADFSGATIGGTMLGNINFNQVKGLDSVRHTGPSIIGLDTIYKSEGSIPETFCWMRVSQSHCNLCSVIYYQANRILFLLHKLQS